MRSHRFWIGFIAAISSVMLQGCGIDLERMTRTRFRARPELSMPASGLRPGDIILRLTDAPTSTVLAGLVYGHYSHAGLVFFRDGHPWVADCLGLEPRPAIKAVPLEEFLASQRRWNYIHVSRYGPIPLNRTYNLVYEQETVHYTILRYRRPLDPAKVESVLEDYLKTPADYDFAYRLDNDSRGRRRLYCTEFIWLVMKEVLGAEPGRDFQVREDILENIDRLLGMSEEEDIRQVLRKRYGDLALDVMKRVGAKEKKAIQDLPPGSGIITPDAFLRSPHFMVVDYRPAGHLGGLSEFFDHYHGYMAEISALKSRGTASAAVQRRIARKLAHRAGRKDPLYYLRGFLLRPTSDYDKVR